MIDLTKKALPNTITVGGRAYSIYTDYRVWMRFVIEVGKMQPGELIDTSYLWKNDYPKHQTIDELLEFAAPKSELPRNIGNGCEGVIPLDYELDSDLIYSAFLGQYGIDLVDIEELHWWKFLALIKGLNDSTRLKEIMGYRCYQKSDGKSDIYEQLKRAWEIVKISPQEQAELDELNRIFK